MVPLFPLHSFGLHLSLSFSISSTPSKLQHYPFHYCHVIFWMVDPTLHRHPRVAPVIILLCLSCIYRAQGTLCRTLSSKVEMHSLSSYFFFILLGGGSHYFFGCLNGFIWLSLVLFLISATWFYFFSYRITTMLNFYPPTCFHFQHPRLRIVVINGLHFPCLVAFHFSSHIPCT